MKKLSYNEIVNKCRKKHGDRYIYPLDMLERKTDEKVPIICPKHGEFWQMLINHYKGCGCPKCGGNYRRTNDEFKEILSQKIKNEKISFEKVDYKNNTTPIILTCSEHGDFKIIPSSIKEGKEVCPMCSKEKLRKKFCHTTEWFIEKAKEIHGNKYDYSKTNYVDGKTKVCITHPIFGEFWQYPYAHLKGQGCVAERNNNAHAKRTKIKTSDFIEKAREKHGDKYDYSKVEYKNPKTKVCVVCPEHGEFWQLPYAHLNGQGCPKCGKERLRKQFQLTKEEFIERAKEIHSDKYDYNKVNYVNYNTKVCIICPKHGEFWQTPSCHFKSNGCPTCKGEMSTSKEEIAFSDFIKQNYCGLVLVNDRKQIAPMELDVFLPFENIAFEYDGLYWHNSEKIDKNYHLMKTELCEKQHIRLYHVFEDEWINNRYITEGKIKTIFGKYERILNNENCLIRDVSPNEAKIFLSENSLISNIKSKYKLGLYFNDELISLMCFKKRRDSFELICFVNKLNIEVINGAKTLFDYFVEKNNPSEIEVKCDRRWNEEETYERLGFKFDHFSKPNKFYVVNGKRETKYNGKSCHQIFDCGNLVYVWKNNEIL